MTLRRIAVGGLVLGLVGVVVRCEGRTVGRALLRRSDARVPETPGAAVIDRARYPAGGDDDRNSLGVSTESAIHAEDNAFHTSGHLTADVAWTPTLHTKIDSAAVADRQVARGAGAGRMP
ncbi:hypothetical protein ACFYZ8_28320 [Streptomyces sp. NPDC001668]|uniref:hypothetical protein n=1 Tax=unclassified Streptomyces TaxID=2593676 RepID=UPI0036B15E44